MPRRFLGQIGMLLGLAVLVGCQAVPQQTHGFPATWPGTEPLSGDAPTVLVHPIQLDPKQLEQAPAHLEGLPTAAVLSALFIKYLHVNGIHAILKGEGSVNAQYALACTMPQLGYDRLEGYPKQHRYRAELSCTLREEATQTVVWERNFKQQYEEAVLVDLMTHLPQQPHRHERILYRECIVPLWDAMASSVGTVVTSREQLSRANVTPAP